MAGKEALRKVGKTWLLDLFQRWIEMEQGEMEEEQLEEVGGILANEKHHEREEVWMAEES